VRDFGELELEGGHLGGGDGELAGELALLEGGQGDSQGVVDGDLFLGRDLVGVGLGETGEGVDGFGYFHRVVMI
jgi:hypothetical protein